MSQPELNLPAAQKRIDQIQDLYREWQGLLPQLEAAQNQWLHAMEVAQQLAGFYENEYQTYHLAIENGLEISWKTEGEYSILSEDTLWNMLQEHYELSWFWLRAAIRQLDPQKHSGGTD